MMNCVQVADASELELVSLKTSQPVAAVSSIEVPNYEIETGDKPEEQGVPRQSSKVKSE